MERLGVVGGIGPESTIAYYRSIIAAARDLHPTSPHAPEPVLWVLLSLAEQPRHGYGLMKDVETLSEGRVPAVPGGLHVRFAVEMHATFREALAERRQAVPFTIAEFGSVVLGAGREWLSTPAHVANSVLEADHGIEEEGSAGTSVG